MMINTVKFVKDNKKLNSLIIQSINAKQHPIYLAKLATSLYYKVVIYGKQIGSIIMSIEKNEIYIHMLYIWETNQRKGYGTLVVNHLKGMKRTIQIYVSDSNQPAHKFWSSLGFVYTNRLINLMDDIDHELKWYNL